MNTDKLVDLLEEYRNAPKEYKATSYWDSYEKRILDTIRSIDLHQLRSGKYPILATFGFGDVVYTYHPNMPVLRKVILKIIHRYVIRNRAILPYQLAISDIQEMAYHHCELMANSTESIPITEIEVSTFGSPQDVFEMNRRKYTIQFLSYYIRYCFSNKHVSFKGDEILVELGSGSGYQIEVLKKLYPNITILCFDLPAQIYLCEQYLARVFEGRDILGTDTTRKWSDLSDVKKGGIHFFGNWQIPLLRDFQFDVFWNAASFGEMEPDVVENYLENVKGSSTWIYLLQARHGKEKSGRSHVKNPITLADYNRFLSGYALQEVRDAWQAHSRLRQSGGYFEGVWKQE